MEKLEYLKLYSEKIKNSKEIIFTKYTLLETGFDTLYYFMDSLSSAKGKIINLKEHKDSTVILIDQKVKFWEDAFIDQNVTHELILPGLLTSTNADTIKADTLQFIVNWDRYFSEEYVMK